MGHTCHGVNAGLHFHVASVWWTADETSIVPSIPFLVRQDQVEAPITDNLRVLAHVAEIVYAD